jgi:CIC family chloride channel protein
MTEKEFTPDGANHAFGGDSERELERVEFRRADGGIVALGEFTATVPRRDEGAMTVHRAVRWLEGARGRLAPNPTDPSGNGFEASRYLLKWLVLGSLIGAVAGLGAVLFIRAIDLATRLTLGDIAGYLPPSPIGEGTNVREAIGHPWLLPLVTALGGLISGAIVFSLAPEAEGHGTDAAIEAIHHKGARLRGRVVPIKLVASAITIGTGGSGGREGPAAQISAGFASVMAQFLKLTAQDRRIAVAAGMGAGIGAIFRAPLGGALMAAEILYLHDLEVEALVPGLIASIVGYSIFGSIEGWQPIFGAQPELAFSHAWTLIYYAALGVACGLGGLLYAKCFYGVTGLFHRLRIPRMVKPALGGLLVGLMGLKIQGALHTGYGWVQISMSRELLTLPLWIVLALPFAKILATSLSIGSGGSGGIFGPGMVIGGMLGAAFWRLGDGHLPGLSSSPAPFVIIGMMALFGGIAHAPLAVMLMVAEMTGNLSLLAPAMVAVALSTALVGDRTIYLSQLPSRADSPMHRLRLSFPLLSSLSVRDAMKPATSLGEVPQATVTVAPGASLTDALECLSDANASKAEVLDHDRVIGTISVRDMLSTYRSWMARGVRRTNPLPSSTVLLEATLEPTSALAGVLLRDANLPPDTLVTSILREGEAIFPRASTRLEQGDRLSILTTPPNEAAVQSLLLPNGRA